MSTLRGALAGLAIVITSFWVAICAAAPEFIWQGLSLALGHLNRTEVLAALLVGLVLAFFVEPVMERIRHLLSRPPHVRHLEFRTHGALFTAGLSIAFALTSICLHEAMNAFVSDRGASGPDSGLAAGIGLTAEWAIVPFAITIAWLTMQPRWLAVPTGAVAVVAAYFTGWLFDWPVQSVIATTIPSLVILGLGYRRMLRTPGHRVLDRCARSVALVGAIWLVAAAAFDMAMRLSHLAQFSLYDAPSFWMDVRSYIGWAIGLALAPSPFRQR